MESKCNINHAKCIPIDKIIIQSHNITRKKIERNISCIFSHAHILNQSYYYEMHEYCNHSNELKTLSIMKLHL